MIMKIGMATLVALAITSAAPASANFRFGRPDYWQCAYGGGSAWHYGDTAQYKPEAMSTALRVCRARSASCHFLGCFRRL
jgi:hypothetical protein